MCCMGSTQRAGHALRAWVLNGGAVHCTRWGQGSIFFRFINRWLRSSNDGEGICGRETHQQVQHNASSTLHTLAPSDEVNEGLVKAVKGVLDGGTVHCTRCRCCPAVAKGGALSFVVGRVTTSGLPRGQGAFLRSFLATSSHKHSR